MHVRPLLAIPLALALGAPVFAQTASPSPSAMHDAGMKGDAMGASKMGGSKMSMPLAAQNGSGETGTVSFQPTPSGLVVNVATDTGPVEPQPVHIHKGTCANLDPAPQYPLTNVTKGADGKGTSTTTVSGVTMAQLTATPHAVNVHKSTSDIKDYVACADIKPAGAMSHPK